jgi:hypothetical protein
MAWPIERVKAEFRTAALDFGVHNRLRISFFVSVFGFCTVVFGSRYRLK